MDRLPQVFEGGRAEHGQPQGDNCGGNGLADEAVVDIIRSLPGRYEQDLQSRSRVVGYGRVGTREGNVVAAFDRHHEPDVAVVVVEEDFPWPSHHLWVGRVDFDAVSLRK